jgi:hypothetical protein
LAKLLALGALVVFGVAAFCLWAFLPEAPAPLPARAPKEPVAELAPATNEPPTTAPAAFVPKGRPATLQPEPAAPEEPRHPHPITPAHERIFRENDFIGSLNGAMDVKDAPGMRRLLARYRAEYPEDALAVQAGYALIADCLERPGAESAAAARRYYETETASTLRRYVRRHCLTPEWAP